MRLRFLVPMSTIPHDMLIRLTQLDDDRDIAFMTLEPKGDLAGLVRSASDPDHEVAEFGIWVRSDLEGHGLGKAFVRRHLINFADVEEIGRLEGLILRENGRMQSLCRGLGFSIETVEAEPTQVRATLHVAL